MIKWTNKHGRLDRYRFDYSKADIGSFQIAVQRVSERGFRAFLDGDRFAEFEAGDWGLAKRYALEHLGDLLNKQISPAQSAVEIICEELDTWGT